MLELPGFAHAKCCRQKEAGSMFIGNTPILGSTAEISSINEASAIEGKEIGFTDPKCVDPVRVLR